MSKRSPLAVALVAALSALAATLPASASAAPPELVPVGEFDSPVYVTGAPGDDRRLFVVERGGEIRVMRDGVTLDDPFLEIPGGVSSDGERGLLSMAFPPDYPDTRRFYVFYTRPDSGRIRVDEFRRSDSKSRALPGSQRRVLSIEHSASNHVGGQLQFDSSGRLYVSIGDNAVGANAQDLGSPLGKLLRIRPTETGDGDRYSVPSSNPFVGDEGALGEIFAYGLRNPFRFSFDRKNGNLVVADVGQSSWEEIDIGIPGANFGWRCFEGSQPHAGGASCLEPPGAQHQAPIFAYDHSGGRCSITGGYVARHPSLGSLRARYVYGDYCTGEILSLGVGSGGLEESSTGLSVNGFSLSSFGEDTAGCLYATTLSEDEVFRLDATGSSDPGPCDL